MANRFLRLALAAGLCGWLGTQAALAESEAELILDETTSLSGAYLAGRSADAAQDFKAAAGYLMAALDSDPDNPRLIERVLVLSIANGDIDAARSLAGRLLDIDGSNPLARVLRAADAIQAGRYDDAVAELAATASAPLAILTSGLMSAWAEYAAGDTEAALARIAALRGPGWYEIFKDYHTALIADLAGDKETAIEAITRAYDSDDLALRVVDAYARILSRAGRKDEAVAALEAYLKQLPGHPIVTDILAAVTSDAAPGPMVWSAETGAAEVLYGLGAAIGVDEGTELPAAYLQLALHLNPTSDLTLMALGDLLLADNRCEDAVPVYERVSADSRLRRNADIQSGLCLDQLERTEQAVERVRGIIDQDSSDLEAVTALGNILRGRERFAEAAEAYSRGIETIADPLPAHWRIFYFRGISYERSGQWDKAEADLLKALELNPDQPQVLNYLGYSWVNMEINLDEGLEMIRQAVEQQPNDGYIVDSLGWAYYRLGRYEEAVEQLERAVELRPDDPVINDHLGDAYWKVGRRLESTFQWKHARDLDPEPKDLEQIVKKLESGLAANGGGDG